jgi:hypothetical protein
VGVPMIRRGSPFLMRGRVSVSSDSSDEEGAGMVNCGVQRNEVAHPSDG